RDDDLRPHERADREVELAGHDDEVLPDREDDERRGLLGEGHERHRLAERGVHHEDDREDEHEEREHGPAPAGGEPLEPARARRARGDRPARGVGGHADAPPVRVGRKRARLLAGSICRRAYSATAAMMMTPRRTSLKNGSTSRTLKTVSSTARMRTPPTVPTTEPRPPRRRVPPSTTAAIESRSSP